jgi:putative transposase
VLFGRANRRSAAASHGRGARGGLCRQVGISEQTSYRWKKAYGNLQPSRVRELKQLRDEHTRLKMFVVDPALDKVMLQDMLSRELRSPSGSARS